MIQFSTLEELRTLLPNVLLNGLEVNINLNFKYPNFSLEHIFGSDRDIIESVKSFNHIQSIRQNINLFLSSNKPDSTIVETSFNNIFGSFESSKKVKQKSYLINNVKFINNIKRIFKTVYVNIDDTLCITNPYFDVRYEIPVTLGGDPNLVVVDINDFIKFINFLVVYSSQPIMVIVNHHLFRTKCVNSVKEYEYNCTIKFNSTKDDSRLIMLSNNSQNQNIQILEINKMYAKFFAG